MEEPHERVEQRERRHHGDRDHAERVAARERDLRLGLGEVVRDAHDAAAGRGHGDVAERAPDRVAEARRPAHAARGGREHLLALGVVLDPGEVRGGDLGVGAQRSGRVDQRDAHAREPPGAIRERGELCGGDRADRAAVELRGHRARGLLERGVELGDGVRAQVARRALLPAHEQQREQRGERRGSGERAP